MTSLLLSLILLGNLFAVGCGYRLYADAVVDPYSLNRTNFCSENVDDVAEMLAGFEGKEIKVAVDIATNPFYFGYSKTTYTPSGLMFDILSEIESRGGFRFVYAYVPHIGNVTDKRLKVFSQHTDIVADTWWTDTTTRRSEGFGFTQAVVDVSLVMVTTIVPGSDGFNPWKFLEPYSNYMWLCLVFFILIHSLLLWGIEGKFTLKANAQGPDNQSIWSYIYYSWAALAGTGNSDPKHPSAIFLQMGFAFFMMVFAAGYTANLANILLTPPVTTNRFADINDANNQGATVCLTAGSAAVTYLLGSSTSTTSAAYPNIKWDTTGVNASVVMQNVANGACDAGIFGNIDWQSLSQLQANNPNCNLVQAGDVIAPLGGAFIYWPDDSYNCTSLVQQVMDYYLVDMKNDGVLDEIVTSAIVDVQDIDCSNADDGSGSSQLTLSDLAGIFFVYVIAMGAAAASYFVKHGVLKEPIMDDDTDDAEKSAGGSNHSKNSGKAAAGGELDDSHGFGVAGSNNDKGDEGRGIEMVEPEIPLPPVAGGRNDSDAEYAF